MLQPQNYRKKIFEQFARLGQATANSHRLELLDLLAQGPQTVETLARKSDLNLANTSAHLRVLRQARLVDRTHRGIFVEYRLADPAVEEFLGSLRQLAEARLAEVETLTRDFLEERDQLEALPQEALLDKARRGEVVVLDVRPPDEFAHGHIPGARSIPLAELEQRLAELPADREIVAYCRGPYCVLAMEAVQQLHQAGLRATRLAGGLPQWRADGMPVAEGNEGGLLAGYN